MESLKSPTLMRRRTFLAGASTLLLPLNLSSGTASAAGSDEVLGPLIEGAKKEGRVVGAGNTIQSDAARDAVIVGFKKRYGLPSSYQVDLVLKNLGPLQKQTEEEIIAGQASCDVIYINLGIWAASLAKRGLLEAFDAPEYAGYGTNEQRPGFNNRPFYVSDIGYLASVVWNKEHIQTETFSDWNDLLKPEYDGKISTLSARLVAAWALVYQGMRDEPSIGEAFFKKLATMNTVTVQNTELAVQKVVSGEYPITIGGATRGYAMYKEGATNLAQAFPANGFVPLINPWFALKKSKNPNGAKLLLNYMRSQEGQQIMANYEGRISGRSDIKTDGASFFPDLSKVKQLKVEQVSVPEAEMKKLSDQWTKLFGI
ncbi:ABC transporter substrate-binding protein [Microvirga zambiensis]|uniref:ABC transporter substrate-binding protein n=1 Tax=Microvirga zambiensis TaxID=1402137 RepID=UPI00191E6018|nr:extracellular solute-binding protein [Microvirga zambiensis]